MSDLIVCRVCDGFSPVGRTTCLHCDVLLAPKGKMRPWVRNALLIVGGASLSMTLAACYGDPCAYDGCYGPDGAGGRVEDGGVSQFCDDLSSDMDLDGHCGVFDCNENDSDINRSAEDAEGDGIDTNCDDVDGVADPEENTADAGNSDG